MIQYAIENALELEPELRPLLPAHMAEFDIYEAPFQSAPDFEIYRRLAISGLMFAVTARSDSELIGYALMALAPDAHHKMNGRPVLTASSLAFYIAPDYRARTAKSFFRAIEMAASSYGASLLGIRARPGRADFLELIGYRLAECVYTKVVGVEGNA
jgi:hypothetical protein